MSFKLSFNNKSVLSVCHRSAIGKLSICTLTHICLVGSFGAERLKPHVQLCSNEAEARIADSAASRRPQQPRTSVAAPLFFEIVLKYRKQSLKSNVSIPGHILLRELTLANLLIVFCFSYKLSF